MQLDSRINQLQQHNIQSRNQSNQIKNPIESSSPGTFRKRSTYKTNAREYFNGALKFSELWAGDVRFSMKMQYLSQYIYLNKKIFPPSNKTRQRRLKHGNVLREAYLSARFACLTQQEARLLSLYPSPFLCNCSVFFGWPLQLLEAADGRRRTTWGAAGGLFKASPSIIFFIDVRNSNYTPCRLPCFLPAQSGQASGQCLLLIWYDTNTLPGGPQPTFSFIYCSTFLNVAPFNFNSIYLIKEKSV